MTYRERLKNWEKGRFAPPPEPDLSPCSPTLIEMTPMRDGIKLYAEIFLPKQKGSFPIILSRSPYPMSRPSRSDKRPISRYLEAGFGFVYQLTRGQGESEGDFHFFKDDIEDGFDTVQWLAEQDWCDGNVGMEGASYLGSTQLLAARVKPPALKCIMPTAFVGNCTKIFPFCHGVPSRSMFLQWFKVADLDSWDELDGSYGDTGLLKHPVWGEAFRKKPLLDAANNILSGDKFDAWREVIVQPLDDEYWKDIHFTDNELAELDIPIFFTDGWYDPTVGPVDFFTRLEHIDPGNPDRYLLVGPWNHMQTGAAHLHDQDNGDRTMPDNAAVDLVQLRLDFYQRYLKGQHAGVVQKDRVRVYISGSPDSNANVWLNLPTFPAPGTRVKHYYLHSQGDARSFPGNGFLSEYLPGEEPPDLYFYNPDLPTPSENEALRDRREIEIRSDVLTYTSDPLDQPLTILGEIKLVFHASSDCVDTDWFAQVTEVFPDGRSVAFHCSLSALRSRYRAGLNKEVFITPGQPEEYVISLGTAAHQLPVGARIRLSIFSANFPLCDPNGNTGHNVASDQCSKIAKQTVFHDKAKLSHLVIPTYEI